MTYILVSKLDMLVADELGSTVAVSRGDVLQIGVLVVGDILGAVEGGIVGGLCGSHGCCC